MNATTREWLQKAEADLVSAQREYRARMSPNHDAACFFAQQCIEKYLKARLVEAGIAFPKTHDLQLLLDLVSPAEPMWESFRGALGDLTSYATSFRYPGASASREMARVAVRHAVVIRDQIRMKRCMRLP